MKTIKEIRELSGLSRASFSRTYHIPVRSLEDWEAERRKCPDYLSMLLERVVTEDTFPEVILYKKKTLVKELGACYYQILKILNNHRGDPINPYPQADIFPTRYFSAILVNAMRIGIPEELNNRISSFMDFIDADDWALSMSRPCPLEMRMYFNLGMESEKSRIPEN